MIQERLSVGVIIVGIPSRVVYMDVGTATARSFEPTFHPERLKEPWELKKPSKIFCCSVADLFAPWTPPEWRDKVFESIKHCPVPHTFQLLTKNPEGVIQPCPDPRTVWLGVTVTNRDDEKKIQELYMNAFDHNYHHIFVSFEPLLEEIDRPNLSGFNWVIIGKLTGSKKVSLNPEWVSAILRQARLDDIPVFIKNNIIKNFPQFQGIQEFPQ